MTGSTLHNDATEKWSYYSKQTLYYDTEEQNYYSTTCKLAINLYCVQLMTERKRHVR